MRCVGPTYLLLLFNNFCCSLNNLFYLQVQNDNILSALIPQSRMCENYHFIDVESFLSLKQDIDIAQPVSMGNQEIDECSYWLLQD